MVEAEVLRVGLVAAMDRHVHGDPVRNENRG